MPRPRTPEHAALGRAIRTLREKAGLSQEELGHRAGLHRNYVGGIERGELNPSFTSLAKLAGSLGLPLSALIEQAERNR